MASTGQKPTKWSSLWWAGEHANRHNSFFMTLWYKKEPGCEDFEVGKAMTFIYDLLLDGPEIYQREREVHREEDEVVLVDKSLTNW